MKTLPSFVFLLVTSFLAAQTPRLVVPIGYAGSVNSVAFSPDGYYVLVGGNDNTLKLWDLSGREIQTFGYAGPVLSVAFSPDGKTVLAGGGDNTAKLWDLAGREIQIFKGHIYPITDIAFSPDGKTILTGSKDQTAKLWDLTGREIQTFTGHAGPIWSAAFSPDGKTVLTGSNDKTAKLWDLAGREIQTFTGHADGISSVAFSPDVKTILTGSFDKTAKLWDLSGHEIQTFAGHTDLVASVAFSPNGKMVLTGSRDQTVKLWDLAGQEIQIFKGHTSNILSIAFSPNGKTILTGSSDKTAKLWDLTGREIQTFTGHSSSISSVAFSPDGKKTLTGNRDGTAKLWNLAGREIQTLRGHTSDVSSVSFSPDGAMILTGSYDHTAKLWNLAGREIQTFKGHTKGIASVAFSPDGKTILTGSGDKTAKLWDLAGREIQTFKGHTDEVSSVAFSPDGKTILTGSLWGKNAKLWELTGREISTFTGDGPVTFSPDGKTILTTSKDQTAKLLDLAGREIQTFKGHMSWVSSGAFSPDGKIVLTGSIDNTAKLWNMAGREIHTFKGHTNRVGSAVFSLDGKTILTGSSDQTAKLWSSATGKELATLIAIGPTDWVVTTPSGLFDASPDAMKFLYYVQGLEVIELDQLKERYYEPGLLAKIMGFDQGELRNVSTFDKVALYPEIKAGITKDQLHIQLTERNGGIGKLSLFINNKEIKEDINPKRVKTLNLDLTTFAKYYRADADNTLALRAYNKEGWLKSEAYELSYRVAGARGTGTTKITPTSKIKPHFYAIVVGTSNYAGDRLDLRFADQDAAAIAQALHDAGAALFERGGTSVRLLSSSGKTSTDIANKTNIAQAFADVAAKAVPADILVVYFSGHGMSYGDAEKAQFYYLTKDIGSEDLSDPVVRNNYTISSDEFTKWLTAIPAQKQVMILDACNAGKVVESLATLAQKNLDPSQIRALDRMKDRTGMFILTGSAADKVSYEASQYGQGLLTYSLLQGMSGLALTEDKRVDVMTLFQYSRDQVPVLAKGIGGVQTPVLAFPTGGASFDIGIVNAGVKISVAQVKPVFIRSVFQDENYGDELDLAKALEAHFRRMTVKGAQAECIYVDVSEYENGYALKGNYSYQGNKVTVKGNLFKGKTIVGKFQLTGNKADIAGLAQQILEKVRPLLK